MSYTVSYNLQTPASFLHTGIETNMRDVRCFWGRKPEVYGDVGILRTLRILAGLGVGPVEEPSLLDASMPLVDNDVLFDGQYEMPPAFAFVPTPSEEDITWFHHATRFLEEHYGSWSGGFVDTVLAALRLLDGSKYSDYDRLLEFIIKFQ
jgi:hypothetical protein